MLLNVEGKTIHSALKVPMCFKSLTDLGSGAVRNPQRNIDPLTYLIVDEFSMIGCYLMDALEQRCREGQSDSTGRFEDYIFTSLEILDRYSL